MELNAGDALRAAVTVALNRNVTELTHVQRIPLVYDAFLPHRAVSRLQGEAVVEGEYVPWSLIEKRTEGPESASPYLLDNGAREFSAYASGLLDDIAPEIRAPRIYGSTLDSDGAITLYLEEVHHDGLRPFDAGTILTAAHDLGRMNGTWFGRDIDEPWYFTGWIDRHAQPEAVVAGLATLRRAHSGAVARLGDRLAMAERLILRQSRVREILESLPHTICHHDAVGANVFRTETQTVLIDWESVGPGPIGADLASLLFSSVNRGDAFFGTVAPIVEDAVHSYADGLRTGVCDIPLDDVRRGFDAAVALRWKLAVDVVADIERGEGARRGSLPDESPDVALQQHILLTDLLFASASRALD